MSPASPRLAPPRAADARSAAAALRGRLLQPRPGGGHWRWLVPLAVTVLGGALRLVGLAHPHVLAFDETYYAKDAYALLQAGYELQWPDDANEAFLAGRPAPGTEPAYVVHPPLGKWMIAAGMAAFGADTAVGWRVSAAVVGTLSVLLVALAAQRLFSSVALGGLAGLLTAVDGHHIVLSRSALLDVFQMFFLLLAFLLLLYDRDDGRRRLAARLSPAAGRLGPWVAWRPWRLAAGVALGGAVGVKWSALAFLAVFGIMAVAWDAQARRAAGVRRWLAGAVLRDGLPAAATVLPLAAAAYVAAWTGWLATDGGYDRHWADSHPEAGWAWVPAPLRSLAEYHRSAYAFHGGLHSDHDWESGPWTWPFAGRPVLFHYEALDQGQDGCAAASCVSVVTDLPNPVIWWAAALSVPVVLLFWAGRRDWRAGAVLSGFAAGYLPWFLFPDRTMFFFYTLSFHPFAILALVYVLALAAGGPGSSRERRRLGAAAVLGFTALALAASAFFWPVWTGKTIEYGQWLLRVWMPSWA